jgi:hypothetical protein
MDYADFFSVLCGTLVGVDDSDKWTASERQNLFRDLRNLRFQILCVMVAL